MTRLPRAGGAEIVVPATPEAVWAVLTDVTRVGEWSHEARSARWVSGAGAVPGAVFKGANKAGQVRWSRPCTVIEAEAPRRFSYRTDGGVYGDNSRWTFDLAPVEGGTRITESYEIESLPRWFEAMIVRMLPHHLDRTAALAGDLERLGALAGRDATRRV